MDPVTAGALIMAGSAIVSGLMGAKAQEEAQKKKMILEGNNQRFQGENAAAQNLGNSQQHAFDSLMSSYRNVL